MGRNAHRIVVFELEETLGLSSDFQENGFTAVDRLAQERLGLLGFQDHCWELATVGQIVPFFHSLLSRFVSEPSEALVAEFATCFIRSQPAALLPSETVRALEELRQVVVLTMLADGPFVEQKAKCLSLRLESLVDRIVFPDYWGCGFRLPHPRAMMSIQNCSGIGPERCTFLAARRNQTFWLARRLGWKTICLAETDTLAASDWGDVPIASLSALSRSMRDKPKAA
ncbi:MAG: hypothetical protein P8N76_12020 [Pirellulaceae bacterium]|nr:hypothetical protein [Pirellulaceae bacterium]